jgi:hypothetical protein
VSLSANWLIYLFFQWLFGPVIEGRFLFGLYVLLGIFVCIALDKMLTWYGLWLLGQVFLYHRYIIVSVSYRQSLLA